MNEDPTASIAGQSRAKRTIGLEEPTSASQSEPAPPGTLNHAREPEQHGPSKLSDEVVVAGGSSVGGETTRLSSLKDPRVLSLICAVILGITGLAVGLALGLDGSSQTKAVNLHAPAGDTTNSPTLLPTLAPVVAISSVPSAVSGNTAHPTMSQSVAPSTGVIQTTSVPPTASPSLAQTTANPSTPPPTTPSPTIPQPTSMDNGTGFPFPTVAPVMQPVTSPPTNAPTKSPIGTLVPTIAPVTQPITSPPPTSTPTKAPITAFPTITPTLQPVTSPPHICTHSSPHTPSSHQSSNVESYQLSSNLGAYFQPYILPYLVL
eukprot:Nitzschia sp. Nitz4//scaffold295_size27985//2845//3801//NITZ4_008159-RA/size27985-processed-gene-0.49-mRNA-1//-1//CDS//3329546239//3329//frame0